MKLSFPVFEELDESKKELGRLLFSKETSFVKGVVDMPGLPDPDKIEVCFSGRSNVGKSSLINALTGRKGLARASNTPGRTQEINFFSIPDNHYLVTSQGMGMRTHQLRLLKNGKTC